MKKVYVAGAYSGDSILEILGNMRRGMRAATEVMLCGYAPFVPWFDYQFQLMLRDEEKETITLEHYYDYSLTWMEVSDYVLVVPGYEKSKGTLNEIKRAKELGIPVFYSLEDLMREDGK